MSEQSNIAPETCKTGVYRWLNTVNGKSYVGSTARSLRRREIEHRSQLKAGRHPNRLLQRSWDKYGAESFTFEILERCSSDKCLKREQVWVALLRSAEREFGYNLSPTAGTVLGLKHTEETRAKMSAAQTGKKLSPEHCLQMSVARKGRKLSEEHKAKISEAGKGRKWSEESRRKLSAALKGKPKSPEHVAKMAAAKRGRPISAAALANVRAAALKKRGVKRPPEVGKKISAAKRGMVFSDEHRAKLCGERRKRGRQKLTKEKVWEVRRLLANGTPIVEIARICGISAPNVSNIKAGRVWRWLREKDTPD